MKTTKTLLITITLGLVPACDTLPNGPRIAPAPRLAGLHDDACLAVEECRQLAEACGDDEDCIEAIEAVVEEPDGEASTIPARIIERYGSPSP